jgi:hypothetical protein
MTPEELLQYYINEKEPEINKGPLTIGDSLFGILNPQVIPTKTVEAESLSRSAFDENEYQNKYLLDSADNAEQKLKPKISLGAGRLGFYGDVYSKHFQNPFTARPAFDLGISQRLTRYLQLNFNIIFGKLGANEYGLTRNENFESEIRAGGLNLMYDFGNFIPDKYRVRPFISLGVCGFEFLSKTDLKDKNGNFYHYWSDGSIRNMAEGSAGAQNAIEIKRDYVYETDIRERNADGFGKYQERAWAMPVGAGFVMKVTDRIDLKLNFQYFFTTTDYIDGLTGQSSGNRVGTKFRDNYTYSSVSIQYDLIAKPKKSTKTKKDTLNDAFWLAYDKWDGDKDGVSDFVDDCLGTDEGAKVDEKGCPTDDDKDGVPNHLDFELDTPPGMTVDKRGVARNDSYWQKWYDQYMNDSTGVDKTTEVVENIYALNTKKMELPTASNVKYTVELKRYQGNIPSDEMAYLLSIGDVKTTTLEDGTTIVYTAGEYKKVKNAVRRRDEFRKDGLSNASISKLVGKNVIQVNDDELQNLMKEEKEKELLLASQTSTSSSNDGGANNNNSGNNDGGANNNNEGKNNGGNNNGGNNNGGNNNGGNSVTNNQGNNKEGGNNKGGGINNGGSNKGVNNSGAGNSFNENEDEGFTKSDVFYRVQLGAFKHPISTKVFNTSTGIIELKAGDSFYKYVTKGYKTIEEAAAIRADLVIQGYSDAFVTAYKDGKRVLLSKTNAKVEKSFKEDLSEDKLFSSVDKKLVIFKIQLAITKTPTAERLMDAQVKEISDVVKQGTNTGGIRFTTGNFNNYNEADKTLKELQGKGFSGAFVIPTFKGEIISLQEAMELLK